MRIAIISDIHGNLEALKMTFKDIEKRHIDKIICLGDIIAKGNHSVECLKLVKEKCDVVIRGNCDRHFSENNHDINKMSDIEKKRLEWNQSLLNKEQMEWLNNLPFCYEFGLNGSLVRLFHATPWTDREPIVNEDSIETKYKMFLPTDKTISHKKADIVLYGHIHHPFLDKIYNRTLINVGSVGFSFDVIRNKEKDANLLETTVANYFVIEGDYESQDYTENGISFEFRKVKYDIEKELNCETDNPEKDNYIYEIRNGMYGNMQKINDNFKRLGLNPDKF